MRNAKLVALGVAWSIVGAIAPSVQAAVTINEIRVDNPGGDINEYFELAGTPGESLAGLYLVVLGDPSTGTIEEVTALSGVIPADGYFLFGDITASNPSFSSDATGDLNFENDDVLTFLLVSAAVAPTDGTDLDTNDDGTLDITPWTSILDSLALLTGAPDTSTELPYSSTQVGPDAIKGVLWHAYRFANGNGPWLYDSLDNGLGDAQTNPLNYLTDTPGAANVPEPASLGLIALAGALGLRRRR